MKPDHPPSRTFAIPLRATRQEVSVALEKLAPASTPVCLSTKCGGRRCVLQESIPQRRMRVAPMYALPSSGGKHPNPGDKRLPRVRPILDATGLGCELAHCAQCCGGRSSYSRGRSDIPAGPYLTPALRRPNGDHWLQQKGGGGVVSGPRGAGCGGARGIVLHSPVNRDCFSGAP